MRVKFKVTTQHSHTSAEGRREYSYNTVATRQQKKEVASMMVSPLNPRLIRQHIPVVPVSNLSLDTAVSDILVL